MIRFARCLVPAVLITVAAGCGPDAGKSGGQTPAPSGERPAAKADPAASAEGRKFLLASEPAGVKGVIDARKYAKDGDEVVVAGQVGGAAKPFTEGRAGFVIADTSLTPTDGCDTPWDFCELPKKDVAAARLAVKFVDAEGKTLKTGAREMFGLRELSVVVVKGKLARDDKDNVTVVASGIHVRPASK